MAETYDYQNGEFMKTEEFNHMLRAARALLAADAPQADQMTLEWARQIVAANPTEKRRPSPLRDEILALFDTADGLTREQIAASLPGKEQQALACALHDMTHRAPLYLWAHRHKGHKFGQYYSTQAARDAAANDAHAALAAALDLAERKRQAKASKNLARTLERAEARKAKEATKPKAADREFNGAESTFKTRVVKPKVAKPSRTKINPDQGMPWVTKPKPEQEPIIPPGLKVIVCPGYRARHERWADGHVDGAGFAAAGPGRDSITGNAWG